MTTATEQGEGAGPVCVMTRFRLGGPLDLVRFWGYYRRVKRSLNGVPGLLHVTLLAEGPLTLCILSVWRTERHMGRWIGDPTHVDAVHTSYGLAREIWSGRWRLAAVSPSARRWTAAIALEGAAGGSDADDRRGPWRPGKGTAS